MALNIKPLSDRVLIEPVAAETQTASGIFIPDTAKEKPMQGKVIAVGKGTKDKDGNLIPLDVKVGDKVLYGKWGGTEVKVNGQEFIIMKESDIMGIIN